VDRALVLDVARVQRSCGLEEDDFDFFLGDRTVLDTAGDDEELTGAELDAPIAEFHDEAALVDEEHLVLMLVVMPDELAFELGELDVLAVEFRGNARRPVFGDACESFIQVDLHGDDGTSAGAGDNRPGRQLAIRTALDSSFMYCSDFIPLLFVRTDPTALFSIFEMARAWGGAIGFLSTMYTCGETSMKMARLSGFVVLLGLAVGCIQTPPNGNGNGNLNNNSNANNNGNFNNNANLNGNDNGDNFNSNLNNNFNDNGLDNLNDNGLDNLNDNSFDNLNDNSFDNLNDNSFDNLNDNS
jgi:hypothetical protein